MARRSCEADRRLKTWGSISITTWSTSSRWNRSTIVRSASSCFRTLTIWLTQRCCRKGTKLYMNSMSARESYRRWKITITLWNDVWGRKYVRSSTTTCLPRTRWFKNKRTISGSSEEKSMSAWVRRWQKKLTRSKLKLNYKITCVNLLPSTWRSSSPTWNQLRQKWSPKYCCSPSLYENKRCFSDSNLCLCRKSTIKSWQLKKRSWLRTWGFGKVWLSLRNGSKLHSKSWPLPRTTWCITSD